MSGSPVKPRTLAKGLSSALIAIPLAVFWIVIGVGKADHASHTDFLNLYTGASLARDGRFHELHDPAVQLTREREYQAGTERLIPFVRPHLYALFLAPLALMSPDRAFAVWIALQCLLAAGVGWWAWRRIGADALLWWLAFPPLGLGIVLGQDNALMLAVLTAGWVCLERGNERVAGLVWSLLLIKLHLVLGPCAALLWLRRRRALVGFCAGGATFATLNFALAGREGIAFYIQMLTARDLPGLYPGMVKLANVQGLAAALRLDAPMAYAFAAPLAAFLAFRVCRAGGPALVLAACMASSLLLTPHVYIYDWSLMQLPLLLLMAPESVPALRWPAGWMLSPLGSVWTLFDPPWCAITPIALLCWLAVTAVASGRRGPATSPAPARA